MEVTVDSQVDQVEIPLPPVAVPQRLPTECLENSPPQLEDSPPGTVDQFISDLNDAMDALQNLTLPTPKVTDTVAPSPSIAVARASDPSQRTLDELPTVVRRPRNQGEVLSGTTKTTVKVPTEAGQTGDCAVECVVAKKDWDPCMGVMIETCFSISIINGKWFDVQ